jgi:hypothetical protein
MVNSIVYNVEIIVLGKEVLVNQVQPSLVWS